MRKRPLEDLLLGLWQMGGEAVSEFGNGCLPLRVNAQGIRGGFVRLRAGVSSQFVSALLLVAPYAQKETVIELEGPVVSEPYIDMTIRMMREFGVGVVRPSNRVFRIPPQQRYWLQRFAIEPDATAASYFFGAAAIMSGRITVQDLKSDGLQGDVRFADVIRDMNCRVEWCDSGITVHGRPLTGIDVDMNDISDCVPTLAAVACFADGPTTIRNVAHIRHKESDRIAALATELRKVGAEVEEFPDGLKITPRPLHGAEIETYNDHRIAMSMALIGLKVPGIILKNPSCVAKTYPGFWDDLESLRKV
jgi:3-phosphoshikimate 1-carboxyvinyltransferase